MAVSVQDTAERIVEGEEFGKKGLFSRFFGKAGIGKNSVNSLRTITF